MKKKILFGAPTHFDLHKMMIQNLENSGFDVYSISMDEEFKYDNLKDRLLNLFHKIILKDKTYKREKLYYKFKEKQLEPILKKFNANYFDYALIIRADIYPTTTLASLNTYCKKTIAYQWDGLERFTGTKERILLFDKFYVFDNDDFLKYKNNYPNLYLTNNFYSNIEPKLSEEAWDIFYIGVDQEERTDQIIDLMSNINTSTNTCSIQLLNKNPPTKKNTLISYISQPISYEKNLLYVKKAKALIDLKTKDHNGLSFRFFECIKYQTKIITSNVQVKKYDFYKPENIFILGEDRLENLQNFIDSPYSPIEESIFSKYSFENWIKNLTS